MIYRIGDDVVCIKEDMMPKFIGTEWVIIEIIGQLYICECKDRIIMEEYYPFKEHEIVLSTPLIRELL